MLALLRYAQCMFMIQKPGFHPPLSILVTTDLCDEHPRAPSDGTSLHAVIERK